MTEPIFDMTKYEEQERDYHLLKDHSKYLQFKLIETKPKTKVYAVMSKMHGSQLGIIKWFSRWRCYAFFPDDETIWNVDCLKDIKAFLEKTIVWHKSKYKECICGHNGVTTISHLDFPKNKKGGGIKHA